MKKKKKYKYIKENLKVEPVVIWWKLIEIIWTGMASNIKGIFWEDKNTYLQLINIHKLYASGQFHK